MDDISNRDSIRSQKCRIGPVLSKAFASDRENESFPIRESDLPLIRGGEGLEVTLINKVFFFLSLLERGLLNFTHY